MKKVKLIGFQEKLDGSHMALVNDENNNTYVYNSKEHDLKLSEIIIIFERSTQDLINTIEKIENKYQKVYFGNN